MIEVADRAGTRLTTIIRRLLTDLGAQSEAGAIPVGGAWEQAVDRSGGAAGDRPGDAVRISHSERHALRTPALGCYTL